MADLSKTEAAALARIETLEDPGKLRVMMSNAERLGSDRVKSAAFLRLCEIQPEAEPGTVVHDVWQSIYALEEMLKQERGRTTRLSRTRQKIARDGETGTVVDLVCRQDASQGFTDLIERGHPELTFEAVVLRHADAFPDEARKAARNRLQGAGLDPDDFSKSRKGA